MSAAVDEQHFGGLLLMIDEHPSPQHLADSARVKAAIIADGNANDGEVDPNRVRAALRALPVTEQPMHKNVGAAYAALRAAGFIERAGLGESDDFEGGNAGKPIRLYRLTEKEWSA